MRHRSARAPSTSRWRTTSIRTGFSGWVRTEGKRPRMLSTQYWARKAAHGSNPSRWICGLATSPRPVNTFPTRIDGSPFDEHRKEVLRSIPHLTGGPEVLTRARNLIRNERSLKAIDHLEKIYSIIDGLQLGDHLTIDLGEIRGFDYYSGILFRAYVPGLGFEVANGGRYDGLPAQFGHDTPAVGFSFSLDRLEQIVDCDVGTPRGKSLVSSAEGSFEEARRLRRAGQKVKLC